MRLPGAWADTSCDVRGVRPGQVAYVARKHAPGVDLHPVPFRGLCGHPRSSGAGSAGEAHPCFADGAAMTPYEQSDEMDRELARLMADVSDGLDLSEIRLTLTETSKALLKQAKVLAASDYKSKAVKFKCEGCGAKASIEIPLSPMDVARAQAHSAKVLDEVGRLFKFWQGQADSRPDVGSDWLRALTPEQLAIVKGWIEGAK